MKLFNLLTLITLTAFVSACTAQAQSKRWVGVVAVMESPLVNQVVRESGNDPAIYGMRLRQMLDAGQVQPASGRYCLIPYRNGRASEQPECFFTRSGVYTMWAPAAFVSPNRSMCVRVPRKWPAIVAQIRYPMVGGRRLNCRDFGEEAKGSFARTRHTAAMIIIIAPAG